LNQKQIDKIIRCYENKISDYNSLYYKKKSDLLNEINTKYSNLYKFKNLYNKWQSLNEQINQLQDEKKKLVQIYKERISLFSQSFLAFTYAITPRDDINDKLINQSIKMVQNEFINNKHNHFIANYLKDKDCKELQLKLNNNNYKIEIQKANTEDVKFMPITNRRALIRKYKLILNTFKQNIYKNEKSFNEDISGSKIFFGLENLNKTYNLNNNSIDNKHIDNKKVYNQIEKEAKSKSGISISEYKEKIKKLINDNENMVTQFSRQYNYFKNKLVKKNNLIKEKKMQLVKPNGINSELSKLMGININNNILSTDADKNYKIFVKKLLKEINAVEKKYKNHRIDRKIIAFSKIDEI